LTGESELVAVERAVVDTVAVAVAVVLEEPSETEDGERLQDGA
jgi:hypothetical protein